MGMDSHTSAVLALLLALSGSASSWASDSADESLYQKGLQQYARGDRAGALAVFRESLRRHPDDPFARAAVRRVESELARGGKPKRSPDVVAGLTRFERLVLVDIPRWYHFERTVGDCLSAVGTQQALNARVRQLLVERRVCRAAKRRCPSDRPLRELVRRAPLAARGLDEV